jgi:hypothetical protein
VPFQTVIASCYDGNSDQVIQHRIEAQAPTTRR